MDTTTEHAEPVEADGDAPVTSAGPDLVPPVERTPETTSVVQSLVAAARRISARRVEEAIDQVTGSRRPAATTETDTAPGETDDTGDDRSTDPEAQVAPDDGSDGLQNDVAHEDPVGVDAALEVEPDDAADLTAVEPAAEETLSIADATDAETDVSLALDAGDAEGDSAGDDSGDLDSDDRLATAEEGTVAGPDTSDAFGGDVTGIDRAALGWAPAGCAVEPTWRSSFIESATRALRAEHLGEDAVDRPDPVVLEQLEAVMHRFSRRTDSLVIAAVLRLRDTLPLASFSAGRGLHPTVAAAALAGLARSSHAALHMMGGVELFGSTDMVDVRTADARCVIDQLDVENLLIVVVDREDPGEDGGIDQLLAEMRPEWQSALTSRAVPAS